VGVGVGVGEGVNVIRYVGVKVIISVAVGVKVIRSVGLCKFSSSFFWGEEEGALLCAL